MLSRKTVVVLALCLVSGACQDIRQSVNIAGPSAVPNQPVPSATPTHLRVRHELWQSNAAGQRLGGGPIATVMSTYFPTAANARMPGTHTAGGWYLLQTCVDSSAVPPAERQGRQYLYSADWRQNPEGPVTDGTKPLDGGEACHRFGQFRPDTSGANFETTLRDTGGTPGVNSTGVSNLYVDAK